VVNYSANPTRRVELVAQLGHGVDPLDAVRRIKERVGAVANIDKAKGVEDVADAYDCGDQWGEYTDCIEGKGVCENGNYGVKDTSCTAKATAALAETIRGSRRARRRLRSGRRPTKKTPSSKIR
jgi:hypothetical protein